MILEFERPNRLISDKSKTQSYHSSYAKWVLSCISMGIRTNFVFKSLVNWAFYKGNQWLFHEDLDAFLLDESGESRNRIKFVQNIIRPFVEYYTGSAIRMDISARAYSTSSQAIDRKQEAFSRAEAMYEIYKQSPEQFKGWIKEVFPVGETKEETSDIFNNLYKDKFEEDVNDIITYLAERNDLEDKKVELIKYIVLDGIGIAHEYERFGNQVVEIKDPRRFFFDESAKRSDLKDAEFMGHWELCSLSDIVEEIPNLSMNIKSQLEKCSATSNYHTGLHNIASFEYNRSNGKIPKYYIEWRDISTDLFGAVINESGVPELVLIGDGSDEDKLLTPFTKDDLIPQNELYKYKKDNFWIDKSLKGKNSARIMRDVLRFCKFVPSEYIGNGADDLILEYGLKSFEPKYSFNYKYPDWSYKIKCWSYDNGDIMSPIDDLISPQRFINRVLSMGESQINNTRGSGIIIDKNVVEGMQGGEEEVQRSINLGKPLLVDGQVNNSIGTYNNTIGTGTIQLFDIAKGMEASAKNVIGGGESLMGQGGAYRASATVNNQNLNQGTTMQEPVFYCVHKIILDIDTSFANRGRRILCANQNQLVVATGEDGMKVITLTRDHELEDYRIQIKRAQDPIQERQQANAELLIMLQSKLISEEIYGKYYNRSTMNTIGQAIREHQMIKIEQARQQQKMQQAEQQKIQQAAGAQMQLQNLQQDHLEQREDQQLAGDLASGNADVIKQILQENPMEKGIS